jgi:hypothetical protein
MHDLFHCSACGGRHDGPVMSFGAPAPQAWFDVPEADREQRCLLSSDQCVIDNRHFFLLGQLELAVIDGDGPFTWLTWVSVSERSFERASQLWDSPGRESEPHYFAWVNSRLPYSPSTVGLAASLVTEPVGNRPQVVLHPSDHPLYLEQSRGVPMARVLKISESLLHAR